jgi:hypothetical protein
VLRGSPLERDALAGLFLQRCPMSEDRLSRRDMSLSSTPSVWSALPRLFCLAAPFERVALAGPFP